MLENVVLECPLVVCVKCIDHLTETDLSRRLAKQLVHVDCELPENKKT